jgi:hypothetical protein
MSRDVVVDGSPVWDRQYSVLKIKTDTDGVPAASPAPTEGSAESVDDELGAFASLTTDEDRERKAECASPGTYNVVVNPDSFQHMPEYSDDPAIKALSPLRRSSLATSLASSLGRESAAPIPGDPNVVVLRQFEDTNRRTLKDLRSPSSPTLTRIKTEDLDAYIKPDPDASLMHLAVEGGGDFKYLQQFRSVVWKQLVQVELEGNGSGMEISSADVLEHVATSFPPLFHAMMALAALSMAQHDTKARLDALEHYDQSASALQSNLRTSQDLSSDGAFLTHFLLLVYEIAGAETGHSNMWSQQLSTLLQISKLRREIYHGERYPFITWWICNIDLYALFSGAGRGDFVGTMLREEMIPPPGFHLYPLGPDGSSIVYADEITTLPAILQLNYEVTLLAVRLGLLAQELRHDAMMNTSDDSHQRHFDTKLRLSRVFELQESLRGLWIAESVILIGQQVNSLPFRSKQLFEHASSLYRACMIYSHTSMWPLQKQDTGPEFDAEIAHSASDILMTAEKIVNEGRLELRFIIFPLFMAGFASTDGSQKMMALDLVGRMEKSSIGSNTTATRRALGIVYERQTMRFMNSGQDRDVDWLETMIEQGLGVVSFGL